MRKFNILTCLLILSLSASLISCRSAANRAIAERNTACVLDDSPDDIDPRDIRTIEKDYWNRTSYTAEWITYAREEAECIRASECAMRWEQWDGNCGWQAADRYAANPLRAMIGITFSCDIPKPICK